MIRFLDFLVTSWRYVMDVRFNPLRFIKEPVLQSYLMIVLFTMWSAFFGLIAIYYLGWLGYSIPVSIGVHMAIIIPIVITNGVFLDAERTNATWLTNWKRRESLISYMRGKNVVRWDLDNES
jgi:hypothetical protein